MDELTEIVYRNYPSTLAGSEVTSTGGLLYIKGDAPEEIVRQAASSAVPVVVVDGLRYNMEELQEISQTTFVELRKIAEFEDVVTTAQPWLNGLVTGTVTSTSPPNWQVLASRLTEDAGERIILDVKPPSATFNTAEAAFAGMRTRDSQSGINAPADSSS